jgi:hypothetical protein
MEMVFIEFLEALLDAIVKALRSKGETEMRLRLWKTHSLRLSSWEARIYGTLKKFCLPLIWGVMLANTAIAQNAVPLSRTNRSLIPTQDQPAVQVDASG